MTTTSPESGNRTTSEPRVVPTGRTNHTSRAGEPALNDPTSERRPAFKTIKTDPSQDGDSKTEEYDHFSVLYDQDQNELRWEDYYNELGENGA